MQSAGDILTNKRGDPQHNPTVNSCLVRIPGSINSKCGQAVKIIQRWDGQRPAINYLLREFRRWLIDEKIEECKQLKWRKARPYAQAINSTKTIWWIEKLLQTPIDDYRKFAMWRILGHTLLILEDFPAMKLMIRYEAGLINAIHYEG
jgi:hypothetical protein